MSSNLGTIGTSRTDHSTNTREVAVYESTTLDIRKKLAKHDKGLKSRDQNSRRLLSPAIDKTSDVAVASENANCFWAEDIVVLR